MAEPNAQLPARKDSATKTVRAPASATFVRVRGGKPPLRFFYVTLELENPHDYPVWFLTRNYGDKPLHASGVFTTGGAPAQPFEGKKYDGGKGGVVEINCLGNEPFIGFYLAANRGIKFDEYPIEAWDNIKAMELWEVRSLKVNDRTPLEKWLPYSVMNDPKAVIPRGTDWKNLDWDAKKLKSRTDYPKEVVRSVNAKQVTKWTIPIKGIKALDP